MYYLIRCESFTVSSWYIMSDDDPKIKKFFEEYYKSDSIETKLGWLAVGGIKRLVKKSENLYDLIEKGDLIAFEYMDTKVIDIANVNYKYKHQDGEIDVWTRGYLHNNDKIKAIYKPNSKGDYIKVWEREKNV